LSTKRPINLQEISVQEGQELMTFPCHFPLKVLAKNKPNLDALVVSIVCQHNITVTEGAVKTRLSKGGKYASVTVSFEAQSRAQLDALYQQLSDHPDIRMVL